MTGERARKECRTRTVRDLTDERSASCVAAPSESSFTAFIPLEMSSNFTCPAFGA